MTFTAMLKHPSAWLPVAMSLAALSLLLGFLAVFGVVHEPDEGTAAHLFQLLIVGQVPIVAFFALKWLVRAPLAAMEVLALQAAAVVAAFGPVYYVGL